MGLSGRPRVLLFDWATGGHHPRYVERVMEALGRIADVVAAVPNEVVRQVEGTHGSVLPLGSSRPGVRPGPAARRRYLRLARQEVALLRDVIASSAPDHVLHLYGDPLLRQLIHEPRLPVSVTLVLFQPRAHYRSAFGTRLRPDEMARAWRYEQLVAHFRRRPDAGGVLTLDPVAAERWMRAPGARAGWLPEPPVLDVPPPVHQRSGIVLFGTLARRKGIDLLTAAVERFARPTRVVLAGEVEPGFGPVLECLVNRMRRAGATVEVRGSHHTEAEGLAVLTRAACAVLPYRRHFGMSRVLLESASVGTPVVADGFGLVGHLVRERGLGRAVDCADAASFADALADVSSAGRFRDFGVSLARFAADHDGTAFATALSSVVAPLVK